MMRTQVKGEKEIARGLAGVADHLTDLSAPGDEAGRIAADRARGLAPFLTGALAGSIDYQPNAAEVDLIAAQAYAGIQEFGSRYVAGQRYMTGALEQSQEQMVEVYRAQIQGWLGEIHGAGIL